MFFYMVAKRMLQQMKLNRMFDENNASFDYISKEQIAISNIFHRSVIDIHEVFFQQLLIVS
jgi:serine protease inhibitor